MDVHFDAALFRWRLRSAIPLLLDVLFALVLEQAEVLINLLKRVVLAIERMDYVILVYVDLVFHIDHFFDEINKLLHLFAEKKLNMICEFFSDLVNKILTELI